MQKGSFRCRSFHFTGDGRTNGTAVDESVLPSSPGLALSILCNLAANIMALESRWETDSSMTSGGASIVVGNKTVVVLSQQISSGQYMYYTYLRYKYATNVYGPGLLLIYGSSRDSTEYATLKTILGSNDYSLFAGGQQNSFNAWSGICSGGSPYGVYAVYSPSGAWTETDKHKRLKLLSTGCASSLSYTAPLAYYCSSATYTYHVAVSEETVGIFTTSSGWSSTIKGFVTGPLIDNNSLSPNDTVNHRLYASFNTLCGGPNSSSSGEASGDTQSFITYEINRYASGSYSNAFPWVQFFKTDGNICSAVHSHNSSYKTNITALITDNYYCMCQNGLRQNTAPLAVSPVGVGVVPKRDTGLMVDTSIDLISGSLYKGNFVQEFLLFDGQIQNTSSSSWYPAPPSIGTLFDNGNYMYIGCGFLMGWHPDNGNILTNTGDPIIIVQMPT